MATDWHFSEETPVCIRLVWGQGRVQCGTVCHWSHLPAGLLVSATMRALLGKPSGFSPSGGSRGPGL